MALHASEQVPFRHYVRGDVLVLSAEKEPVFIYTGQVPETHPNYDPKQGFFVFPDEKPTVVLDKKNLIVNDASILMARRMHPSTDSFTGGINALAIGTGVGTGTTQNPQAADPTLHGLRNEIFRKLVSSWTYLDTNNNATSTPTNVVQITTNFTSSDAIPLTGGTAALVEMGLFGGDTSTAANNTLMYNMTTFPVWNYTGGTLTVVWTLTF